MNNYINWNKTPENLSGKVLVHNGCHLHYWMGGKASGPPIVMSHGATMDHRMFNAQVEALSSQYQVLVWDARGHGRSRPLPGEFNLHDCAEDLDAILKAEGITRAILVGQSMGGLITQYFYLKEAQKVSAVILIGATSIALPYPKWQIISLKASLPAFNIWPHKHFIETVARSTALKPDVQDYARQVLNSLDRKTFLAIWKAVTLSVNEQGIPGHKIKLPLLLTHGDSDNAGVVRKQAPTWAAYEPYVSYIVIPEASHNANQDNPEFFNQILLEFLEQVT